MVSQVDWQEILDGQYLSYTVEVNVFLDSVEVSSSPEISSEIVYDKIKADPYVCDNLKLLYHESIFGQNKKVKKRIYNRICHFLRSLM